MSMQGHPSFVSLPPLPEGGENPEVEVLDADVDEEISLASTHTPDKGEGSKQSEEGEGQEQTRKKRRLKKAASTASALETTVLGDDDSSSSSPLAEDPVAVAPLHMAPPASAPGFTRFIDVHSLVDDDDDDDARYVFAHHSFFLATFLSLPFVDCFSSFAMFSAL